MGRGQPVIIVFGREPIPGASKTRLNRILGPVSSAALADAFTRDALRKARELQPALLILAGSAPGGAARSNYFRRLAMRFNAVIVDQGTGSLGDRMASVLRAYSEEGALLLGTDTPSLPITVLAREIELLRRWPVVLGPALDGGYYLIGVRSDRVPEIFHGMAWGRSSVLDRTIRRLEAGGFRYALGPWWYDVDRWADLSLLVEHLRRMFVLDPATTRTSRTSPSNRTGSNTGMRNPCPATVRVLRELGLLS